jgi:hypothetical protein
MDIVLIWTIWATAFTAPPQMDVLEQLCRQSHPQGRITVSREFLSWNERHYPAAMIICARPIVESGESGENEPQDPGAEPSAPSTVKHSI